MGIHCKTEEARRKVAEDAGIQFDESRAWLLEGSVSAARSASRFPFKQRRQSFQLVIWRKSEACGKARSTTILVASACSKISI